MPVRRSLRSIHECFNFRWRSPLGYTGKRNAQELVASALVENEKIEVARLLCTKEGTSRLKALLDANYITDGGLATLSFGAVAVPLCYLLSNTEFVHCNPEDVRQIFLEVVKHLRFFREYGRILEGDYDYQEEREISFWFSAENEFDAAIPIANLGCYILTLLEDFTGRDEFMSCMRETTEIILTLLCRQVVNFNNTDLWRNRLTSSLQRLGGLLASSVPQVQDPIANPAPDSDDIQYDPSEFRTMRTFPSEADILRPARRIRTSEEVYNGTSCTSNGIVPSYIDYHFRLLREDMLMSYRSAVQHFLQNKPLCDGGSQFLFRENGCEGSCAVFWNVAVENILTTFEGVCFRLRFDQFFNNGSSQDREKAWSSRPGKYILQPYSHVCLIFDIPGDMNDLPNPSAYSNSSSCKLVMATVGRCGRGELHKAIGDCSSLRVFPISQADRNELILRISPTRYGTRHTKTNVAMIQVREHFTGSIECVIKSLQMADWMNPRWFKRIITRNFLRDRTSSDPDNRTVFQNPSYLSESTTFDLSFLVRKDLDTEKRVTACRDLNCVNICSPDTIIEILETLREQIILDRGQIKAFAFGLSQEVACIQGPPGCRKNEMIAQIVKALIVNGSGSKESEWRYSVSAGVVRDDVQEQDKLALFPILCVSESNASLDSLLESLITMKTVTESEILRIGGQSKSQRLQDRKLNNVKRNVPSPIEPRCYGRKKKEYFVNKKKVMEEVERIEDYLQRNSWAWADQTDSDRTVRSDDLRESRKRLMEHADSILDRFDELQGMRDVHSLRALRSVKVIGCTSSGAAIYKKLLRALGPPVVIFQEANNLLEAHILASLTSRTEQILLFGDYLQSRPWVREHSLKKEAGLGYDLDISMFERLVLAGTVPMAELTVQSRMHPEISKLARLSYPRIQDSASVRVYPEAPRGLNRAVFFLDHTVAEEGPKGNGLEIDSPTNKFEVDFIVGVSRYMIQQGYEPGRIAVISPSLAQLVRIKKEMRSAKVSAEFNICTQLEISKHDPLRNSAPDSIWTDTMDDERMSDVIALSTAGFFSGCEADIVLISTAYCNDCGLIGDLDNDSLVNVMVTRAKYGLIILGSTKTIRDAAGGRLMKKVVEHLSRESVIGPALPLRCEMHGTLTYANVFEDIPKNGRTCPDSDTQKECGHVYGEICRASGVVSHERDD